MVKLAVKYNSSVRIRLLLLWGDDEVIKWEFRK